MGTATGSTSCASGGDYKITSGTVVFFALGPTTQPVNVPVCADSVDGAGHEHESFNLRISTIRSVFVADGVGVGAIDDLLPGGGNGGGGGCVTGPIVIAVPCPTPPTPE
jgi:hypothetical protein